MGQPSLSSPTPGQTVLHALGYTHFQPPLLKCALSSIDEGWVRGYQASVTHHHQTFQVTGSMQDRPHPGHPSVYEHIPQAVCSVQLNGRRDVNISRTSVLLKTSSQNIPRVHWTRQNWSLVFFSGWIPFHLGLQWRQDPSMTKDKKATVQSGWLWWSGVASVVNSDRTPFTSYKSRQACSTVMTLCALWSSPLFWPHG